MEEIIQGTESNRTILNARRMNDNLITDAGTDYVPSQIVVFIFQGKILQ